MPVGLLLNTAATIAAPSTWNGVGEPTYAAAVNVRARVEPTRKMVQLTPEQKIRADAAAFVGPLVTVQPGARFTVSGRNYRVLTVETCGLIPGVVDHKELLLAEER